MSVLINLAPDLYIANQRDKQRRSLAISVSTAVSVVAIGILITLFVIVQAQKIQLSHLQERIKASQATVSGTPDLVDAVTVQQNLAALPSLYAGRSYVSKFFPVLISVMPSGVSVSSITIDATGAIAMAAQARNYNLAAKFEKALEASNVTIGASASASNQPFFTNISLDAVSGDSGSGPVTFGIKATLSPEVTRGN